MFFFDGFYTVLKKTMNKTIKINPNLLLVKRRRDKKEKKESNKEKSSTSKNVENLKRQLLHNAKTNPNQNPTTAPLNDSLNYLSKLKQKQNPQRSWVEVNLDNPEALFPSTTSTTTTSSLLKPLSTSSSLSPSSLTPSLRNDIPYGCLKKGKKPTYRNYKRMMMNETRKSNFDIVESLENVREKKLEELKQRQQEQVKEHQEKEDKYEPLKINLDDIDTNIAIQQDLEMTRKLKNELAVIDELKVSSEEDLNKKKTLIKKTVCKKYILGKNEEKNLVSVLIKNAERKNEVIQAKQDLSRTKLNKVKQYLLQRNLMKKGSEAPATLLLEMFKSARLTGDIYNVNFNTMLETFVSDS